MEVKRNIFIVMVIVMLFFDILYGCINTNVKAALIEDDIGGFEATLPETDKINDLKSITIKFLNALRVLSILTLLIIVVTTGYRYVTSMPNIKEEIKKTMLPIILGLIFIFSATTIAAFIISALGK